jgi:ssDNA-binding Zn-finger/Zn-ribbon topoisomerase 1
MKLWAFLNCPRCGFAGCAAPVNESPCPRCGFVEKGSEPGSGQPITAPAA